MSPTEGTAQDIRYTRSKDNTILYAILLGWEKDQKEIILKLLSSDRIDCNNLKSVELIDGGTGKNLSLTYEQKKEGLIINLPERPFEEMAYVIKLSFTNKIPPLNKFTQINCTPHYYIVPGDNIDNSLVLGSNLTLTSKRKNYSNQWKLEDAGKGIYKIRNREDREKVLECRMPDQVLTVSNYKGEDNQFWKIEDTYNGLVKISNKQFPDKILSLEVASIEGNKVALLNFGSSSFMGWKLIEVCELKQEAFKPHTVPGVLEAEDFDIGCPGDAYYDKDNLNEGGQYRLNEGVDIEKCSSGGYNIGWTNTGEWMAYTVNIKKSTKYKVSFYVASSYDTGKFHLECDNEDRTGIISVPNTKGFQNWAIVNKTIELDAGQHVLKVFVDGALLNLDKILFEEVK